MQKLNKKVIATTHALKRRTSLKNLVSIDQREGNPVLYVDVLQGRRLVAKDENKINPFCTIEFEQHEIVTDIVWKTANPRWNESFCFQVHDRRSKLVVTVWHKPVSTLKKDVFLGTYSISVEDLENEEIQNKWLQLEKNSNHPTAEVNGQILLKLQFTMSEKGKMHKLKEIINIDFYDSLSQFFSELPCDIFCLLFDHNKLVPDVKEINALANIILGTREIQASKLLRFVVTSEVNANDHSGTLFRRNSLASKLTTACLNRFGGTYLKCILESLIFNLCTRNESLEIDPHKAKNGNVEENMKTILNIVQSLIDKICNSIDLIPYEIREVAAILAESVEKKFKDKKIKLLSVGGIFFLRFINPALTSPNMYGIVKDNPPVNVQRTLIILTKILQKLANGVTFGVKEEFMTQANTLLTQNFDKVNKLFEEIIDLSNCNPDTTLDKPKEISFYSAMKITDEDVKMLYSHYVIHKYLHKNIQMIKEGAHESSPPFSLPVNDKVAFQNAVKELEQILQKLGPPVEIALESEIMKSSNKLK